MQPRYPVYVISKGRAESGLTAKFLLRDGVDFRLVIEPQEEGAYRKAFPAAKILTLPFSNLGLGSIPARNWCWEHSIKNGHERHWILDDNIRQVRRLYRDKRIPCDAGPALRATEDFVDRYENVAVAGLNYVMFAIQYWRIPPFYLNNHVYSCLLIMNSIPQRWRGRYNEDTDLCLQVLSAGWCTVLMNAFLIEKMATMTMKGGNTAELYKGDGRLKMSRSLERVWPGVVQTARRFNRPQHRVKDEWAKFDTQLRLKPGIDLKRLKSNEYGLGLAQAKETIKSEELKELLAEKSKPNRSTKPRPKKGA